MTINQSRFIRNLVPRRALLGIIIRILLLRSSFSACLPSDNRERTTALISVHFSCISLCRLKICRKTFDKTDTPSILLPFGGLGLYCSNILKMRTIWAANSILEMFSIDMCIIRPSRPWQWDDYYLFYSARESTIYNIYIQPLQIVDHKLFGVSILNSIWSFNLDSSGKFSDMFHRLSSFRLESFF